MISQLDEVAERRLMTAYALICQIAQRAVTKQAKGGTQSKDSDMAEQADGTDATSSHQKSLYKEVLCAEL